MRKLICLTLFAFFVQTIQAQSLTVSGQVVDESGMALPYSTITILNTNQGTSTNSEGKFILKVPMGKYELEARFIGYSSQTYAFDWANDTSVVLTLKPNTYSLDEVELTNDKEDLAKAIMRKAQARAKFHKWIYKGYKTQYYIKATAIIENIPFLLSGALNSIKIEENVPFTSETISEIEFSQPNLYKERIISYNGTTDKDKINPGRLVKGSFYSPEVYGATTPLSPNANLVYTYDLLGSFYENGVEINKVKIIPRLKKDKVFSGVIYIRSNTWDIHSLELSTTFLGNQITVSQTFAPTEYDIFLPQTTTIKTRVDFWGVEGDVEYLASSQGYELLINPDFVKSFKALQDTTTNLTKPSITKVLAKIEDQEIEDQMQAYEDYTLDSLQMEDVSRSYEFSVDSNLMITDVKYWDNLRPVPLTKNETLGLKNLDSAVLARDKEEEKKKSFFELLKGNTYQVTPTSEMNIDYQLALNMVSGYQGGIRYEWFSTENRKLIPESPFYLSLIGKYHHAWDKWTGNLRLLHHYQRTHHFGLSAGRILKDINPYEAVSLVHQFRNAYVYSKNYTEYKLEDFVKLEYTWYPMNSSRWSAQFHTGIYERTRPTYQVTQHYLSHTRPDFLNFTKTPEEQGPELHTLPLSQASEATSFISEAALIYRPFLKFQIRNGKKNPVKLNSTPWVGIGYETAIPNVLNSTADYGRLKLKLSLDADLNSWFDSHHVIKSGLVLYNREMSFYDYGHFYGNSLNFMSRDDKYEQFMNMDMYANSTSGHYATYNANFTFDYLLITALNLIPAYTMPRERLTFNALYNHNLDSFYTEVGYSLDILYGQLSLGVFHTLNRNYQSSEESMTRFVFSFNQKLGF